MTLYAVSRTNMRRKYLNKGWKNALGSMGWNWQRKGQRYWNLGGLPGKTGKDGERGNQTPLTSLVSRFIAEWTEGSSFTVVG